MYLTSLMSSLEAVAQLSDQKAKGEQYRSLLQQAIARQDTKQLEEFVDHSKLPLYLPYICTTQGCPAGNRGSAWNLLAAAS